MRLIDADNAIRKMDSTMDMQDLYLPIHFKEWVIDECPTVDAVEVVRCKDCKLYVYGEDEEQYYCRKTGIGREEDFYCAHGERRNNEYS